MEAIPTPYRPPASSQPVHTPSYLPDSHTLGGSLRTQPTASPSLSSSDCRATSPPRRQSFDPSSSYMMSQPYGKSVLVAPTSSSRDALASSPPPTDPIDQYASYGLDPNSLPLTRTSFSSQYANSSSGGRLASSSQRQTPAVASYHDRAPPSSSLAPPPHRSFSSKYSEQHLLPSSSSSSTYPPQRQPLNDYSVLQNASSSHLSSSHRYSRIFTDEELALQPSQEGRRWSDPRESVGGVVYPSLIRKRRRRTTPQELSILEAYFAKNALPCHEEREAIASELSMTARHVQIWFQNKRQTEKKKSNPSSSQQTSTFPNPDDLSLPQSSTYTDHAEDEDDEDRSDRPSLLHRSSSATESGSDTLYEDEASMPSLSFSSSSSGSLISIPESSQSVPPPPLPPILEALVTSKADADPTPRPRRLHQTGSFGSSSSAISPNFSADRSELPLLPSTPSAFRTSISKSTSDSNVARTSRLGKTPSAGRSMMDEVVQSRELPFNQSSQKKRRRSVVDEGGRNEVSGKVVQSQKTDGRNVWKAMVSDPPSTDDLAPPAEDDGDKTDTERPISSQRVTTTSSQGHQRHLSSTSTSSLLPPISKTKPPFRTPAKTPYASLHQALSLPSLHRTQQPTSFQSSTTTSASSTTRTAIPSRLGSSSRRTASLDHVASRPPGSSSHAHSQPSPSQTSITSLSTYVSSNHSVTSSHSQDSNGSMTTGRTTGGGGAGGQKRTRIAMGKSGSMDQVVGGSSSVKAGDRSSERKRKMGKSSGSGGRKSIGAEGGKEGSRRRWSKAGIIDDEAAKAAAGEEANEMEKERKAVRERMTKARSGLLDRALASPVPASSSVPINAPPAQPSPDTARSPPPPPPPPAPPAPPPPPHSTQQPKAPTAAEDDQECAMLLLGLLGGGR